VPQGVFVQLASRAAGFDLCDELRVEVCPRSESRHMFVHDLAQLGEVVGNILVLGLAQ
jgi:hypothetical protein